MINRGAFRTRPQTLCGLEISCLSQSPCQDGSGGQDVMGWGPRLLGASMEFSPAERGVTLTGNRPRPEQQAASGGSGTGRGAPRGFLEPRLHGHASTPCHRQIRAPVTLSEPRSTTLCTQRKTREPWGSRGHLPAGGPAPGGWSGWTRRAQVPECRE